MNTIKFFALTALFISGTFLQAKTIRMSELSPDRKNATAAFLKALKMNPFRIIFDNAGFSYQLDPVYLTNSDLEIIIGRNVELIARKGAYKTGGHLLRLTGVKNVVIRGEGNSRLVMRKKDYLDPSKNVPSEYRHALSMEGCENIVVKDLSILSSGGDGIYIGGKQKAKNVKLQNLVLDDHYRQGISVISAENLLIENCIIKNTLGVPPQSGIDLEPNKATEILKNIVIRNCMFINNGSAAITLGLFHTLKDPVSVTVKNCTMTDNGEGFRLDMTGSGKAVKGAVNISDIKIITTKDDQNKGTAIALVTQRHNGIKLTFRNVFIDTRPSSHSPIVLSSRNSVDDIGNIDLGNMVIRKNPSVETIRIPSLGAAGLKPFAGNIFIEENGVKKVLDLKPLYEKYKGNAEWKKFIPAKAVLKGLKCGKGGKCTAKNSIRIRGINRIIAYGQKGNTLSFEFVPMQKKKIHIPVNVYDSNNRKIGNFVINKDPFNYKFKVPETGIYQFEVVSYNPVTVNTSEGSWGFAAERLAAIYGSYKLYIPVAPNCDVIQLEVCASPGEPAGAELLDASGKVRAVMKHQAGSCILRAERAKTEKMEFWTLKIINAKEDHAIRMGKPLNAILFTEKEFALIPEK